jgi:hypothetical protein
MAVMPEASRIVDSANEVPAGAVRSGAEAGRRRNNCRRNCGCCNAAGKLGDHFNPPGKPATQSAARSRQMKDSASTNLDKLDMR